jgi:hypothetical protein
MPLSRHSTPGTSAGFAYQFERALYWLATSPSGSIIGLETYDDVAVQAEDGARILEQAKHSIGETTNPFSNHSHGLWNTLSTWLDAVEDKEVKIDSTHFLMVTNKHVPKCIAKQIGSAKSKPEITACIQALKTAAAKPSKTIANLTERVLQASSEGNLRKLIQHCELADASVATASRELRKKIIGSLPFPTWASTIADSIIDELLGWVHTTSMTAWEKKQPAWIHREQFVNQFHAVLDSRKRQINRERAENLIPITDETVGEQKGRPFVKQLYLVTDDDSIVETGIREFIRCSIEKSRLSAEGNITDQDWKAFEATLWARWDKIQARILRMSKSEQGKDVGFHIFTETTESHREKLAGHDTEQVYLTSGTYHRMADKIKIGWHPRFKQLMEDILKAS